MLTDNIAKEGTLMDNTYHTTKSVKNKHLSAFERGRIAALLDEGYTRYAIAKKLNRSFNTIKNEIIRGSVEQVKNGKKCRVYYAESGQLHYEKNREHCHRKSKFLVCAKFINEASKAFVQRHHSFDVSCGTAKAHKQYSTEEMVCTKTLYNYVERGLLPIKNIDLPLKVKRKTKSTRTRKHMKKLGTSISERPAHINDRTEFGHWEIDTVIGEKTNQDAVLVTITERKTRANIVCKAPGKTADAVYDVISPLIQKLGIEMFNQIFKTLTADNGAEFARLSEFEAYTNTRVFFAHPYASWERGTNERHNGLIRRFLPKGTRMSEVSFDQIEYIQKWCNTLPRKILGYDTPEECFQRELELIV